MAAGILALALLAMPAYAHDSSNDEELKRLIAGQQRLLEAQQRQLDELRAQVRSLIAKDAERGAANVAANRPSTGSPAESTQAEAKGGLPPSRPMEVAVVSPRPSEPPPNLDNTRPQKKAWVSDQDRYDQESPSGSNVTYIEPAIKANIPGSDTDIGLHGFAQFQIIHDTTSLNNNRFDTATIPVDGAPSQTKFNVNPSQIQLSSTTPVSAGRLNTMISLDFNGQLDRPEPRLRVAMGEFVSDEWGLGLLGGQTYATMFDLRAVPETLDFAGPAGLWQQRQPMLRVSKAFSDALTAEFALETPENVSYVDATKRTRWPDFVAAGTWHAGGQYIKHLRLAGLLRDLRAEAIDGATDSTLGWAVSGSGKLGLPFLGAKDNFKLTLHYGDGYGTQLKGGPKEAAFDPVRSKLEKMGVFGAYGGIQHFWFDRLRSNLVYGYVDVRNPGFVNDDALDSTEYAAVDLVWSPFESADIGIEYLWGRRQDKNGESGTGSRFLFHSKVKF
jgi:hypothetical protein